MNLIPEQPVLMLSVLDYAEVAHVDHRTVRDWLAKGLLAGAIKDGRGRWLIPATARKAETAVAPIPEPRRPRDAGTDVVPAAAPTPLRAVAFVTEPEAAHMLGLSLYRVQQQRADLESVPWGPNGAYLVPAYTLRKYLGL